MLFFITAAAFASASAIDLDSGSMSGYFTLQEVQDLLSSFTKSYPDLAEVIFLGQTTQSRHIKALRITNQNFSGPKSISVISASQTSGDPISTSSALYAAHMFLNNTDSPYFDYLLKTREIFILPLMNPDAYALTEKYYKRGHGFIHYNTNRGRTGCTSLEANGVMLDRNWGYKWNTTGDSSSDPCSQTFPGLNAFSEIETYKVRDYFNNTKIETWLHYEYTGNNYTYPFNYLKMQEKSLHDNYVYDKIKTKMQPDWKLGSLFELNGKTQDGTLIDYYQSLGTVALQGAVGEGLTNQSDILNVLEEHYQVALIMTELSGSFLNYLNYHAEYKDCGKKCKETQSQAQFEFLFENTGLDDTLPGVITFVINSGFVFDESLVISACWMEYVKIYDNTIKEVIEFKDALQTSDTIFYVEKVSAPALSNIKFVIRVKVNGTHESGIDLLTSLSYEFTDDIHPSFSVNGVMRKDSESKTEEKSIGLIVSLCISLVLLVIAVGIIIYMKCKSRKHIDQAYQSPSHTARESQI